MVAEWSQGNIEGSPQPFSGQAYGEDFHSGIIDSMDNNPKIESGWRDVLQRNIVALGMVSFLTDLSSEMIYPLLPLFFSGLVPTATVAVYIGIMEGVAESVASLLKFYSGRLSDLFGKRKPLALLGYTISTTIRPFTAFAVAGWQVVGLRLGDRIGKGIRTAPRDALISESVPKKVLGRAFSFHRTMDHAGAVAGPIVAAAFLYLILGKTILWQPGNGAANTSEMTALRWLFALAAIPGLAATAILWKMVKEKPHPLKEGVAIEDNQTTGAAKLPARFYIFLTAVVTFTLGNSSDLFLIFFTQTRFELGLGWIISLWVLLHLSKIFFSLPGGWVADRFGRRSAIMVGWGIYAAVYMTMPLVLNLREVCLLLLFYGIYYGMTEGAERALVADFVEAKDRGRAYGWYHGAVGLATLPASLIFGLFWASLGPKGAFFIGASLAMTAMLLLSASLIYGQKKEFLR